MSNNTIVVNILDKDYQIACPSGQEEALKQSAAYLNAQMRTIRETGKVIGLERIAVMAALNISNELLQSGGSTKSTSANKAQLKTLNDKIEEALQRFRQLEIS